MRTPTTEQRAVLDSTARVRIVRAAPGSGKTWLVAELIRKELETWPAIGAGIAALSFTRVGGEEIRKALGYELSHPHFVGTIDAFLFRYVVRPFLKRARPNYAAPRLIPADWSPGHWTKGRGGAVWQHRGGGGTEAQTYNLLEVCFVDEDANGPVLARPRPYQGGIEIVAANDRTGLLAAKRQGWQRLGWLTHADAAFLASELLADPAYGTTIKTILLRRFSLMIVDELQDTGYFLGKSIRLILSDQNARGILVGDPNQAIYEFSGARPVLFNAFETLAGATQLPLGGSQRCLASIVTAATHVKESTDPFRPAAGNSGRALLVRYVNMVADVRRVVAELCRVWPIANIKIVARWNSVIDEFTSAKTGEVRSLHCPALAHMARGVQSFRQGRNVRALANARASLDLAVLGYEGAADEEIEEKDIDPREWKALAIRCLLRSNTIDSTISMQNWQVAVGGSIDQAVHAFGLPPSLTFTPGKLKPKNLSGQNRVKSGADKPFSDFAPTAIGVEGTTRSVPAQTVHGVKGETHDVTVFVCPPESRHRPCPSVAWWPNDPSEGEERRIAYVAMTRTRSTLVLCVSDACYQRLCDNRATFVESFQCKTIDECIAAFTATDTPLCPAGAGA